jgi:hypothetical protein
LEYGFLPLYMAKRMHLQPAMRGAIIGIQPLVELGLSGGLGVGLFGLPKVFFIPAAFASLAAIGLAAMAKSGMLKPGFAQNLVAVSP